MHYDVLEYTLHFDHNVDTPNRVDIALQVFGLFHLITMRNMPIE